MKFGSLFTGIGGFDIGLEESGMQCMWQVEIDDNCNKLLESKYPNVKRIRDMRDANRTNLEAVNLVCGGFPCQDLSVAGKRAGLAGERSGLWFEFHRIIAELKPRWVIIENVPGLLSSHKGKDFAVILRGLVECGYGVAWRILDARYFGVAQRRRRVYIVASLGNGRAAEVLFESEGVSRDSAESGETRQAITRIAGTLSENSSKSGMGETVGPNSDAEITGKRNTGNTRGAKQSGRLAGTLSANGGGTNRPAGNANELDFCVPTITRPLTAAMGTKWNGNGDIGSSLIAHTVRPSANKTQWDGSDNLIAFDYAIQGTERTQIARTKGEYAQLQASRPDAISSQGYGVRRLMPIECERLQGFPDGHTEGFSDSVRYRMLGNAQCVNVARWLGKRIMELES